MKQIACALLFGLAFTALAQETQLGADFRKEGERFNDDCTKFAFGTIASCGQLLFTDHPLHIALGSLAPQNGFAAGPAFVAHWTPNESWRLSWDTDAVVSSNASWRAGAYMTAIWTRRDKIAPTTGNTISVPKSSLAVHEYPVFHLYAQSISLNKITYFGLGQDSSANARSYYGMRETIVGTDVVWPVAGKLNLSLFGEANGRFVAIRGSEHQPSPSIEQVNSESTAPGLVSQPAFAQFGEGIRLRPALASGYIRLNYVVSYKQYIAANSVNSFRRFTADLSHQFPLYGKTRINTQPKDFNGPDDCGTEVTSPACPKVTQITRDRDGSFGIRFLYTGSMTSASHVVPFYFDPTLGGSDIDGNPALSSYQDYRFRGPNLLLLSGSFEHSLYGPFGLSFSVDEGKVALLNRDIDFSHLAHSYTAGLTLRAGGFPQVYLLFSFGGQHTSHTIASLNTALLGASGRPSLF